MTIITIKLSDYSESKDYAKSIEATGCKPEEAGVLGDFMRNDIFHSNKDHGIHWLEEIENSLNSKLF